MKTREEIEERLSELEEQLLQHLNLYEVEELTELPHEEYVFWQFTQAKLKARIDELIRVLNYNK